MNTHIIIRKNGALILGSYKEKINCDKGGNVIFKRRQGTETSTLRTTDHTHEIINKIERIVSIKKPLLIVI